MPLEEFDIFFFNRSVKLLYINKINVNAGWGLETFLNHALNNIGIETVCIDYQENSYSLARKLLETQDNFDALLLQRGCGYLIPLSILKAIQRPRFLIFTELVARNTNQHYLLKSGLFEHIFFRSIPCMNWVKQQGWLRDDQMSLFLSAIDPNFHRYLPNVEKDIEILFIGTLLPRRKKIIDELSQHISITTCNAFGKDLVYFFNRAKIILNLHGTDFLDTETRVYEALACRSFLITERLSEENPFQDKTHLVETFTFSDMKQQIDYYLKREHERLKISVSGQEEVIKFHTFLVRAKQLFQVIEGCERLQLRFNFSPMKKRILYICLFMERWNLLKDNSILFVRWWLSRAKQKLIAMLDL